MSSPNCPKCQGPRDSKALYCPFCGVVFSRYVPPPPAASVAASAFAGGELALAPAAAPSIFLDPQPLPDRQTAQQQQTVYGGSLAADAGWNPYASPQAAPSPYSIQSIPDYQLASRGSRLAAQMLNGLAMGLVLALSAGAGYAVGAIGAEESTRDLGMFLGIMGGILFWIFRNIGQLRASGQSVGKKWLGIKIVHTNGEPVPLSTLLTRRYLAAQVLGAIPIVGPIFSMINILMIFGAEQRCLHDQFADTIVVVA